MQSLLNDKILLVLISLTPSPCDELSVYRVVKLVFIHNIVCMYIVLHCVIMHHVL